MREGLMHLDEHVDQFWAAFEDGVQSGEYSMQNDLKHDDCGWAERGRHDVFDSLGHMRGMFRHIPEDHPEYERMKDALDTAEAIANSVEKIFSKRCVVST
jgi:hypothetical protein